jgi:hypothetical protein
MSPRQHRRRPQVVAPVAEEQVRRGFETTHTGPDGEWRVRTVPGSPANKTYRCPGCDQEIRPGVGHLVAWRADDPTGADDRRHWHTACWSARDRRTPNTQRSRSAPRFG